MMFGSISIGIRSMGC
ncbi:hypothetical protein LINPERPRIM_LOCUS4939 [Linum perenne]